MIITAIREGGNETRVAITPLAVKQYLKLGFEVTCEQNLGKYAGFSDSAYEQAGARVLRERKTLLEQTDILLCISEPVVEDLKGLQVGSILIGPIDNPTQSDLIHWCLRYRITLFSLNYIPRISRAQNLDTLSSQASLAGYRAVLEAVTRFKRAVPMMMTAAGMIHPAKFLILGAGVAGLQAIATAKRLGASVFAFDVRRAAKEQVESLGAQFIAVQHQEDVETSSGYAREMSEEYRRLQAELLEAHAQQVDIIICTAFIPERKAPILLKQKTVELMKPGSVIIDMATSRGGNCELSERDEVLKHGEVTIVGYSNLAGLIPTTASELFANNLLNLLKLFCPSAGILHFNEEDEIVRQALICHDGQPLPYQLVKEQ
jgi:NAD(P) transhydrogenase subunit alpha